MVHRRKGGKVPSKVSDFISSQIATEIRHGYPPMQAVAIAYSMSRKKYPHVRGLAR